MTRHRLRAAILGLLLLVIMIVALRGLSRAVMFPGDATPLPPPEVLERLGLRPLDCETDDGFRLPGVFAAPTRPTVPVLLYFHGNAESVARNLSLAADLGRRGWGVALAEYRGYGGLPGVPCEEGLYKDGEAALRAVAAQGIPSSRVVLVGRSLGSGVAVELAARGHGRALVLIAPHTSMVDMGRTMVGPLATWLVADRFDNAAKARRVAIPALVVHGTRDEVIPFRMGDALARQLPRARFLPVVDAGHNDLPDLADLLAREVPALISR